MSALNVWLTIICMTVANILTRSSFFLIGHAVKLPPKVQHALRYAPAVALAALVVPDLVLSDGVINVSWANPKLIAGVGAALFFLATRHLLGTIIAGMVLFTVVRLAV
jgi:branched-subunit amino acid transport protein